ncbi:DUF4134 domain-containing protein [Rhodocytophaga rosea]|uniref:DUF4134 domain-containing protein n=1 Tax=Rhodocytophaga rosea TaxID=2704465 RepID=A0A6C0GTJ2_9BACT|nr:DUF4134 family protein [Rhodocytophaga rosea]QHT70752.1 DUF4134 domain-containing protein [Rhodocytophaga rosea]
MNTLRKPIFARVLLLYVFFSLALSTRKAYSQFVVADLIQDINTVIQTASQAMTEFTTIKDAIEHSDFYKYLKAVSSGVQTYNKVKAIIESEKIIINSAITNLNSLKTNRSLTVTQISGMIKMYKYFIDQSAENASQLTKILSPKFFQMSDAERLDFIDRINLSTHELEHHLNYYNTMNFTLVSQQQQQLADLEQMTAFYATQEAATETSEGAYEKIGGFYGSVVEVLYAISALVALVGAVKVYAQFTRGDASVYQTATGWFGSVLLAVIITTFIKLIFY